LASLRVGVSEEEVMGRGLSRGSILLAVLLAVGLQAITPDPDDLASSMMFRLVSMQTAEQGDAPNDDGFVRMMGSVATLAKGLYRSRRTHGRINPLIADCLVPSFFGIVSQGRSVVRPVFTFSQVVAPTPSLCRLNC
jgi:hypothetical protein